MTLFDKQEKMNLKTTKSIDEIIPESLKTQVR